VSDVFGHWRERIDVDAGFARPGQTRRYHVTTAAAAASIEHDGFRDGDDLQGPLPKLLGRRAPRGVWLSYAPLEPADLPEGRRYDACLYVDVPQHLVDRYEVVFPGLDEVWWCIPAAKLNALGRPKRFLYDTE